MTRDDKRELFERLAPAAPPCFENRGQWLEWLKAAEEAHRGPPGNPQPLIFKAGEPVRFNGALNFCADCGPNHSAKMHRSGRCAPNWLRAREAAAV